MRKALWIAVTLLAFGVAGYAVVQYFFIGADKAGLVQTKLAEMELDLLWYIMLSIHALASSIALAIGPFTLSSRFRERNLKLHGRLGKLYMLGILFGGGSGLYLAFHASGGIAGKLGFGTLSIIWLLFAYQALRAIRKKRAEAHRRWMIRHYSLTVAAVTLRIWLAVFIAAFGPEHFHTSYAVIAWLSWVPNLLLAQLWINRQSQKTINMGI